ncbi:MAG: GNAT family N-acetyltransferase [Thermomicrobiales bacterium]|nr:GNAT family N-acetyltransferase [Thermomicrobiales bacterium]MCO5218239.1 GNAT family N-acetyltransferase [Thermomicrobiales bacterium]MCO5224929.1 GNAT family N-acetyltransferase [Thermomicrobiales bacterium]MCO5227736.1 GNAT family N-acetyltransferase [Thermomicrobiales bacterium]
MTETTAKPELGTASQGYTFLVGDEIYLRTFVPGDEKNATSWRRSIFPESPELAEKWIKEDLPKEGRNNRGHLAIVRKSDDIIIGSLAFHYGTIDVTISAHVDPLYGERGQRWLAQALILAAEWQVVENHELNFMTELHTNQSIVLELLHQAGFVETARWREMLEENGQRYDRVLLSYFNADWIQRIGHPMDIEVPRSGTGAIRPIPAKVVLDGDPPANALIVGQRVYLRPEDKKDADHYIKGGRQEDEMFWHIGRPLVSQAQMEEELAEGTNEDYPGYLAWAVCIRENDEYIGTVGLNDVDYVNRTAETGPYFPYSKHRGEGYGSEAKHLLLEYAFEVLGLHMVRSLVAFPNTRSAAALCKQGYRACGRKCWEYPHEGGFGNMVTFDLLASEWRALPREDA